MLYLTQKNAPSQGVTSSDQSVFEGSFSVSSATSDPIIVGFASAYCYFDIIVTSGTASLEYTLDTIENIENNTAIWHDYEDALGNTSFSSSDVVNDVASVKALRLTATGGTSRIVVNAKGAS